jgi:hypothetical protein
MVHEHDSVVLARGLPSLGLKWSLLTNFPEAASRSSLCLTGVRSRAQIRNSHPRSFAFFRRHRKKQSGWSPLPKGSTGSRRTPQCLIRGCHRCLPMPRLLLTGLTFIDSAQNEN